MRGAAAVLADGNAGAVIALFVAVKICLTFALLPIGTMAIVNARMMSTRVAVLGPIHLGPVLGGYACSPVRFIDSDWLGPGEPFVGMVGLLLSLWLVGTAVAILEGGRPLRQAENREQWSTAPRSSPKPSLRCSSPCS